MKLILASASRDKAALLHAAGFTFEAMSPGVENEIDVEETPDGYVRRMARLKCDAVHGAAGDDTAVLGAATVVIAEGRVLGAPADAGDASRMLRMLSGREHTVLTAVCLTYVVEGVRQWHTRVDRTVIELAMLSETEVDWYLRTGESMTRAGAFSMQGSGSRFAVRIAGSPANAMGLPVSVVYELCVAAGMTLT